MTGPELDALLEKAEKATPLAGYSVDAGGNVWSASNWRGHARRQLTPYPNYHGYMRVKVKGHSGPKSAFVHKMVCEAFHGPKPFADAQIRHLNGVKADNRACNLSWGTASENALDAVVHGHSKSAENGRKSAWKLTGVRREHCRRGHHKQGKRSCEQCRRNSRKMRRRDGRSVT